MNNKLETISNLFEEKEIRSIWDSEKEEYYFSVIDVISALTDNDYENSRNYWKWLKGKLNDEKSELVSNTNQLKMKAKDGKMRLTDTLDTEGIFRLIESVPSKKAEPFKLWLAKLGREEVDNVFDPSKGIDKMIDYYLMKGYTLEWIQIRINSIINRKKLTKAWYDSGVKLNKEYAILTNEIYKEWSGMTASEYKEFKGLRKENLRDNMSDIELSLTNLSEITTRELVKKKNPKNLDENKELARKGGKVSKNARKDIEELLDEKVITNKNNLNYQYVKQIEK
ncbi:MAG: phage antirepressor protein [Bacilli bacterium]|nr:phage antirepressor protein [Bacilli bacterium]